MRRPVFVAACVAAALLGTTTVAGASSYEPRPHEVRRMLPAGNSNPSNADGVAVGGLVATYTSSGLGPAAGNPGAAPGTPEFYIDLSLFPGGVLPAGVTVTEAQALSVLTKISANLKAAGLTPRDVITMKAYLTPPPGAQTSDYPGWNRASRQFYANVDLKTGETIKVPMGTGTPADPIYVNAARPARASLGMQDLAVQGWLIEVEVLAAYRHR
jgi:enamine deaminase RidA (YjgF/YER057c/UK114 family)